MGNHFGPWRIGHGLRKFPPHRRPAKKRGYRALSRELLERLSLHRLSDDFVFDNQMLVQILWLKGTFGEVSSHPLRAAFLFDQLTAGEALPTAACARD